MKKIILTVAVNCMCGSLIINLISCNTINDLGKLKISATDTAITGYNSVIPENKSEINIKAVRRFMNEFNDAQNVSWRKTNDGGYLAEYTRNDTKTMACYDRDGYCVHVIRKYSENKMPRAVRAMIRSNFFDHAIMEVSEIKLPREGSELIFRVLIQNAGNFKILRICNYEMEIIGDYFKP